MAKKIVKFLKTHGRYVKGDVAGFEPAVIAKWPKGTCEDYDPKKDGKKVDLTVAVDTSAVEGVIAEARAEVEAKAGELADREQELADREAALADREAAMAKKEAATAYPAGNGGDEGAKAEDPKTAGAPPKQGAKK